MTSQMLVGQFTRYEYIAAVNQLVIAASQGDKVCAKVLMSLHRGKAFPMDLSELCDLDAHHYRAAVIVIRGRVEFRAEPHTVIPGGLQVFEWLCDQWGPMKHHPFIAILGAR